MAKVNDELFDAANRHQTFLIRFGGSSARQAAILLKKAEKDLTDRIAARVLRLGPGAKDRTTNRLKAILADVKQQNKDLMISLNKSTRQELLALARQEVDIADGRLTEAFGVDLNNFRPSPEVLNTLVTNRGVRRRALSRWYRDLGNARFSRLESAIRLGLVEGDTHSQMVRRFRDTEAITTRSASTLIRTHVNHVANAAREQFYLANSDLIKGVRWTATLDGRTSEICQARDGEVFDLNEGPRPPAHPNCRSVMTPVTKSWNEIAGKPLKPGRGASDVDTLFRRNLKAKGFTDSQVKRAVRNTRSSLNGQVPAKLSYQDWLTRQPKGFQDNLLGPTKAKLFRDGGLKLDRFVVEPTGRPLTLDEIRSKNSEAWMKTFPSTDDDN